MFLFFSVTFVNATRFSALTPANATSLLKIYLTLKCINKRFYNFSIGATLSISRFTPSEPKSTVIIEFLPLSCVANTVPKP